MTDDEFLNKLHQIDAALAKAKEADMMRLFIKENNLLDCQDQVPDDIIKKYNITYSYDIWRCLYKLKSRL